MVLSPSAGADEALGPFVFRIINILSNCQFLFYLFPLNDMLTVGPLIPIQTHWQSMLTLSSNRSRSPQGHDLYTPCSTLAIHASCQVWLKSVQWFRRRRFLKGFYHIWAWRPSWSCDLDYLYTHWFPLPIDASCKIWL